MKALSNDLRSRIIEAKLAGEGGIIKLAKRFNVAFKTVQRLFDLHKETGSIEPRPHSGGRANKIPDADLHRFKEMVEEKPDRTIEELSVEWKKISGIDVSTSTISRALERCKLTLKKKTYIATERDLEVNKEKRKNYEIALESIPEENRLYIDEAGTNLNMSRSHSRSIVNTRAYSKRSGRRVSNISLIGAIRLNEEPIFYPYDGAVDGERFMSFLKDKIIQIVKENDVVIMDNCRIHHIDEIEPLLKSVGARAEYLPPYTPELNPIEEVWSLAKGTLKSMESRTIPEYIDALKIVVEKVTKEKIKNFFDHARSFLYSENTVVNANG